MGNDGKVGDHRFPKGMMPPCRTGLDPVSAHDHNHNDCGDRAVYAAGL